MNVCAVIAASGQAKRMGGINKQLLEIQGMPVAIRSCKAFEECAAVTDVVIVTQPDNVDNMKALAKQFGITKLRSVVAGGKERQDSVYNGLKACPRETEIVCVHDGARPLIQEKQIVDSIEAAARYGAAVVGVPLKDTVKIVGDGNFVVSTPDRKTLWAVQTPQTMQFDLALQAFKKAFAEGFYGTDDVQLVERFGGRVIVVEGSYENLKITTPEDVHIAEKLLSEREKNKVQA